MKILYDHQVFTWGKYAGIPRYFSELILALQQYSDIVTKYPDIHTLSADYGRLRNESYHNNSVQKLLVACLEMSRKYIGQDPTRIICYNPAKPKSISLLRNGEYDVFHPTHFDPYFLELLRSRPFVMTVYDLIQEAYPEYHNLNISILKKTELLSEHVTHVIAISEYTRKGYMEYYDVDPDKVTVTHLASSYTPETVDIILQNTSPCVLPKKKYLLYVNARSGRKNFSTMVVALRKLLMEQDMELICVGGGLFTTKEKRFLQTLELFGRVHQCSVGNDQLCHLYRSAVALVFPSVDEGFGLPTLDAFACGCPVILSSTSCMPEIAGDAGVYFDPKNLKSIEESVLRVISDDRLQEKMRYEGYKQLQKFSWDKCAQETKKVYEKAME